MNDSRAQLRFERWWSRGVLAFIAVFMVAFAVTEREGLLRLAAYVMDALGRLPQASGDLAAYYAALPASALVGSALVGGVFGALATLAAVIPARAGGEIGPLPPVAWLAGGGVGLAVLVLGLPLVLALVGAIMAAWLVGWGADSGVRAGFARVGARLAADGGLRRAALICAASGFAVGAVGAQFLTAVIQHCTYLPDAPFAEQQIGQGLTLLSAAIALVPLWTLLRRTGQRQNHATAGYFRSPVLPYVLLAPTVGSLLLFLYAPAIQSLLTSLKLRRFPLPQEQFVCLRNYVSLAGDAIYRSSFTTTLVMTVAIVGLSLGVSLLAAVLASQKVRGANIYRTLLIWPFALSPVVTGAVFLAMFRDGGGGLINALLAPLGITLTWLRDATLAPWVIVAASVWNILGFNVLFYIAGLQNVPRDLLEAAEIDGANRAQRFRRITVPMLAPYTFFLLVTNVTYSFYGVYGAIDALTQGGPPLGPAGSLGGATNALIFKLYKDGFAPGAPLGMASAQAVILFVMVAALTILQFRVIEARISYGE